MPELEISWGEIGSEDGQLDFAHGVGVDTDGNVYIADTRNDRVQKFDHDGNFLLKWGTSCDVEDGTGCLGDGDGQFNALRGIDVDANGNVYVADSLNCRIQKFDTSGNFLAKWGSCGNEDGQFAFPRDVAAGPDGTVYTVDNNLARVQKFDSDGTFLARWQTAATPRGVSVDDDGIVYVITVDGQRVQKFTADGDLLLEWGSRGSEPGQFIFAEGITVDDDSVYVADSGNRRIQQFDKNGTFIVEWGAEELSRPVDIEIGSFFIVQPFGELLAQRWGLAEEPTATASASASATETATPTTPPIETVTVVQPTATPVVPTSTNTPSEPTPSAVMETPSPTVTGDAIATATPTRGMETAVLIDSIDPVTRMIPLDDIRAFPRSGVVMIEFERISFVGILVPVIRPRGAAMPGSLVVAQRGFDGTTAAAHDAGELVVLLSEGPACVGDCGGDGQVTVDEIVTGVNIALGLATAEDCPPFDSNGDGQVTVDELIAGVNNALDGCPAPEAP